MEDLVDPFLGFVLSLPALVFDGFVTMKLWSWFVAPTFHHAPHLGLGMATGLCLLVSFVTMQVSGTRADVSVLGRLLAGTVITSWALFLGFIVTLFA